MAADGDDEREPGGRSDADAAAPAGDGGAGRGRRKPAMVWAAGVLSAALAGFGTNALTGWWQTLTGDGGPPATASPAPGASSPATTTSAPPDAPVRHRGTVTLLTDQRADLDSLAADWGATSAKDLAADVWFDGVRMVLDGNYHSLLGVLPPGTAGGYETCAHMGKTYGIPLPRARMTDHQAVCVITDQKHVAVLRITHVGKDSAGRPDELVLDAVVYVPPHTG